MKTTGIIVSLIIGLLFVGSIILGKAQPKQVEQQIDSRQEKNSLSSAAMQLTSLAFSHNQSMPPKYTCDVENVNPPLSISDVPEGAKSLALIVDDPDAPRGDWVHWLVWNISPNTKEVAENSFPQGAIQGITDFGKNEYGGPCPPSGTHRYQFKLYALDTTLSLSPSTKKADLEKAMEGYILTQTMLVGLYQRT